MEILVTSITLYHNPHCSKSRATLALLQAHGHAPHIIEYLNNPPDAKTLLDLANRLGQPMVSLLRKGDSEADLSELNEEQLAEHLNRHPKLIQRPIVVIDNQARIGRPPESVLEILP